jgi:hypothetical protein
MENLSELQIRHHTQARWPRQPPLDDLVAPARRVPATSKAAGRKELRIMEFEGTYMHDVFCKERVIVVGGDIGTSLYTILLGAPFREDHFFPWYVCLDFNSKVSCW